MTLTAVSSHPLSRTLRLLYRYCGSTFLAKIAVASGAKPALRVLGRGDCWSVSEVVCRAGPHDRPFEEQHRHACIALVVQGTFQYQSSSGRELMTPGSLLLGNAGQYFKCGHEHGVGDRCISFGYDSEYFEGLAIEARSPRISTPFSALRVPPVRELSALVARACASLAVSNTAFEKEQKSSTTAAVVHTSDSIHSSSDWEEIGCELAARTLEIAGDKPGWRGSPAAESRVTRSLRMIESQPDCGHSLAALAREAKLSRYHFLRTFRHLTGLTPHRYILRARLRKAATRLMLEPERRVADVALDSGFGDISNFNHSFHAEFGVNPRSYRRSPHRTSCTRP
jgi:AraC family transcriptional regulator